MLSLLLNLLVPGAGLILQRREWVGFLLSIVFALGANAAIAGYFIAPEAIPAWLSAAGVGIAAFAWLLSQAMLHRQMRQLSRRNEDLALMLCRSREAMERGDIEAVGQTLTEAIQLDDEHVEANVLWARYCVEIGDRDQARRVWQRVCKLDLGRRFRSEAMAALKDAD